MKRSNIITPELLKNLSKLPIETQFKLPNLEIKIENGNIIFIRESNEDKKLLFIIRETLGGKDWKVSDSFDSQEVTVNATEAIAILEEQLEDVKNHVITL